MSKNGQCPKVDLMLLDADGTTDLEYWKIFFVSLLAYYLISEGIAGMIKAIQDDDSKIKP